MEALPLPFLLLLVRLAVLGAERVGFNRLGHGYPPIGAALIAYAGAALFLIPLAWGIHGSPWDGRAALSAVVYAGSFFLYVWGLSVGPLSVVAPWPAATALILWLVRPMGSVSTVVGLVLMVGGGFWLTAGDGHDPSSQVRMGVVLMLLSDMLLAAGRLLDAGRASGPLLPYAATLYGIIAGVFLVGAVAGRQWKAAWRQLQVRPLWAGVSAATNAGAYLSLIALLRYWPPYLVEALSGGAGVLAVIVGAVWLREGHLGRKVLASSMMVLGGGLLLAAYGRGLQVK